MNKFLWQAHTVGFSFFTFWNEKSEPDQLVVKPHIEGLTHTETIELAWTYLASGEIDDIEMVLSRFGQRQLL